MNNNGCPIYMQDGKVIDESMTNVEKILHSKKLNYKDLTTISDPYFKDSKCETVNIYIDLFEVVKSLYSPTLMEELATIRTSTKMNIIAELLNIIGHYRHFFVTRYNKYATVIFYYSTKKDTYYTGLDKEYKKDFYYKRLFSAGNTDFFTLNKVLRDCLTVVKEYLNYIPHAYLIDTGGMDPRLLPYMMKHEVSSEEVHGLINPDDYTIIMTNNNLDLLNLIYDEDTLLFKNNHKDKRYINKEEIYDELGVDNSIGLPIHLVKYLLSISGDKSYGIANVSRMKEKKAFKYLAKKFALGETNLEDFEDLGADYIRFKNNYLLLDYSSYPYEFKKKYILDQFIDIVDLEYIKQETFNIFDASNIVLLDYLFDGEKC